MFHNFFRIDTCEGCVSADRRRSVRQDCRKDSTLSRNRVRSYAMLRVCVPVARCLLVSPLAVWIKKANPNTNRADRLRVGRNAASALLLRDDPRFDVLVRAGRYFLPVFFRAQV